MYETIAIDETENHMAKNVYAAVSDALSDVLGTDLDLVRRLEGPDGTGLTMELSDGIDDLIRDGRLPFSLDRHLEGHFGRSTGSSNVTSVRLERDMNLRETIETLDLTGSMNTALEIIDDFRAETDPDPVVILAYAIAQYAKGWLAEELVQENLSGFKKGSVSNDKGGIDFYLNGETVQLGSITRYNSKKTEMEASDVRHLLYQWDHRGNLHIADMEKILEVNKKVADDAGKSATLTRRSAGNLKINEEIGRSFRYLWW